jgi:uncharacterized membrane protein SirB2
MLNPTNIGNWIQDNIFFVLFIIAAASVAVGAINKKARDAMLTFALAMLALVMVVIAKNYNAIVTWIQATFFTA